MSGFDEFSPHHLEQLTQRYASLWRERDLETRVENQFRQDQALQESLQRLQTYRLKGISHYRYKGAYPEVRQLVTQVLAAEPQHPQALHYQTELAALEPLLQQAQLLIRKLARVKLSSSEFSVIASEVAEAVKKVETSESYQALIEDVTDLVEGRMSVADFIDTWQLTNTPSAQTARWSNFDKERLRDNIVQGRLVLFLGSGVVPSVEALTVRELAQQLAQEACYPHFDGTLSAIAEYYVQRGDLGRQVLLEKVGAALPKVTYVPLYQALAIIPQRLMLISAAYDDLLEQAFRAAHKPFVLLTSIMQSDEYSMGHVWVQFSDRSETKVYTKDDISKLPELERYSMIYKLRGTCSMQGRQDALALTESEYFNFAHHAQEIIPNYVVRKINELGCLFMGYQPSHWEERLIVNALLQRVLRNSALQVLHTHPPQPLEEVFWRKRGVEHCPLKLADLVSLLAEARV